MEDRQRTREARARAGWDPPGPMPLGDRGDPTLCPGPGETLDAFAGHWRLFQLKDGHRYSTDDLLAAWYACESLETLDIRPQRALDLGSGIGSVGLFVVWSYPTLQLVGLEAQAVSLDLAVRSSRFNGVADRVTFRLGDLRSLPPDLGRFDLITGSPPYWDQATGTIAEAPQKGPCRFEFRGGVEAYAEAAARSLAPGGLVVFVFDGRQRSRLERAITAADLTLVRTRDVVSREGEPPLLMLAAAMRPNEAPSPIQVAAPLLLRRSDGQRSPEFRALRARMGMPPGPR